MLATEAEEVGARQEKGARGFDGDAGGDVAAAVEQRRFSERRAGAFRVEDMLATSDGNLPDLDGAVGDDEEAAAGLALLEEERPGSEGPRRAARRQKADLARGQRAEVRDAREGLDVSGTGPGSRRHGRLPIMLSGRALRDVLARSREPYAAKVV